MNLIHVRKKGKNVVKERLTITYYAFLFAQVPPKT